MAVLGRGRLSKLKLVIKYLVVIAVGVKSQYIWFPPGYLFVSNSFLAGVLDTLQHFKSSVYILGCKLIALDKLVTAYLKVEVGFHQFHGFFVYILKC